MLLGAIFVACALTLPGTTLATAPLCKGSEEPKRSEYDAATRNDTAFNAKFRHCFITVDDVQMHAVEGGDGPPLVMLHGWPQTWFEFRKVIEPLAKSFRVLAIDLPGMGDSAGSPPSMDKQTLARYIHDYVIARIAERPLRILAHDLGVGVAIAYASIYRGAVSRMAFLDFLPPGPACSADFLNPLSYHFAFFREPGLAELLIDDEVGPYLETFYPHVSINPEPISPEEIVEFTRTYSRPSVLTNGFGLYRSLPQDEADNSYLSAPIDVPSLLLTQSGFPNAFELEKQCFVPLFTEGPIGKAIPNTGHWLIEEATEEVLAEITPFLAGQGMTVTFCI